MSALGILWRFSRPHTVIGTTLSIISVSVATVSDVSQLWHPHIMGGILLALFTSLCMNVYIVGLNQLLDIPIDRINKPDLPLASGELSVSRGWQLVVGLGLASVTAGYVFGSAPLICTLWYTGVLGTIYSAPPFRLKRFPFLAAFCIVAVRAVIVQYGFFFFIRQRMSAVGMLPANPPSATSQADIWMSQLFFGQLNGHIPPVPLKVTFACGFFLLFSVVIALFKDIPDVEGDAKHNIRSFSVRMGVSKIFYFCILVLNFCYLAGIQYAWSSVEAQLESGLTWNDASVLRAGVTAAGHFLTLLGVTVISMNTEVRSHAAIKKFYMGIWGLFYAEYLWLMIVE